VGNVGSFVKIEGRFCSSHFWILSRDYVASILNRTEILSACLQIYDIYCMLWTHNYKCGLVFILENNVSHHQQITVDFFVDTHIQKIKVVSHFEINVR